VIRRDLAAALDLDQIGRCAEAQNLAKMIERETRVLPLGGVK